MSHVGNKIAFYFEDKRHFDYYGNIVEEVLNSGCKAILIINDTRSEYSSLPVNGQYVHEMIELAENTGIEYILSKEAILTGKKYRVIVSTFSYTYKVQLGKPIFKKYLAHKLSKVLVASGIQSISKIPVNVIEKLSYFSSLDYNYRSWAYPEHLLGVNSIYFPKGLDIDDKFPPLMIQQLPDYHMCHGLYDKKIMEKNIGSEVYNIGYPRYDDLNCFKSGKSGLISEFRMDKRKKIISWLPTYTVDKKNIIEWVDEFKYLTDDYNILVRPHPKQIDKDDGSLINILKKRNFYVDLSASRNMSEIYAQSKLVCCDYGGTIFSAVYTGTPLLLLNTSNHSQTELNRSRSADVRVRKKLFNVNSAEIEERGGLKSIVKDNDFWKDQLKKQQIIRDNYFGPIEIGSSSKIAANKLISFLK